MTEEPEAKATVQLLYREIGALREEVYNKFGDLGESLERRFSEVLLAIDNLRGSLVPQAICAIKHEATEAAIAAAVEKSEADREKLWAAIRDGLKDHEERLDAQATELRATNRQMYLFLGAVSVISPLLLLSIQAFVSWLLR